MSGVTATSETSSAQAPGGVLSDGAIQDEVDAGRLIVEGFKRQSLKPASYDVTVARDGLIDPAGHELKPDDERTSNEVSLQPGDAAMFSTEETFHMPEAVAGNITIKNRLATKGLLLLSGALIDPGYGHTETSNGGRGCRLYLHVANIGKEAVEIRPGEDLIARIQFLRVCGRQNERGPIKASRWIEQKKPSLGFLSDLKELKNSSERTRDLVGFVIFGGIFVLLMTMISVSLAVILSLSSDHRLATAAKAAVPQSTSGKWLWAALVFALAALTFGLTVVLVLQAKRSRALRR